MGDAYRVWDSDEDSSMLKSIKKLAISHQSNHPHFSRIDVIKEGDKAHEALLTAVKYALHKMDYLKSATIIQYTIKGRFMSR